MVSQVSKRPRHSIVRQGMFTGFPAAQFLTVLIRVHSRPFAASRGRAADEPAAANDEAQGQARRLTDADPWPGVDLERPRKQPFAHLKGADGHVGAVVFSIDAEGPCQLARPGTQFFRMASWPAPSPHDGQAAKRLDGTDQNAAGDAFRLGDQIKALVHSINEVDIGVPGWTEQDPRPCGHATTGMSRLVLPTEVGFRLADLAPGTAVDQDLAQQFPGDDRGRPRIKGSRHGGGGRDQTRPRDRILPLH